MKTWKRRLKQRGRGKKRERERGKGRECERGMDLNEKEMINLPAKEVGRKLFENGGQTNYFIWKNHWRILFLCKLCIFIYGKDCVYLYIFEQFSNL